jgi:hypothetical protein
MVSCDKCGKDRGVKRGFITLWNGNVIDLCWDCSRPFVSLVDEMNTWRNNA